MCTKPFQIHIASIIPTNYQDTKVGGLPSQYTWHVQEREEFAQAVCYQVQAVAVRWEEVLYGSCKIGHQIHALPDEVEVKQLKRIRHRYEIVEPCAESFCKVDGADYHFVWMVISEEVHDQLPSDCQTRAHYRHRKVWVPCLENTEIKRLRLKCARSGVEHEFRRCLVNALHTVGLTDVDIDHNEVDKRWFVHKVLQLMTPELVGRLSHSFPCLPGW